jgi:hypothetical protein
VLGSGAHHAAAQADPFADLERAVAAGRLDAAVVTAVRERGQTDAIVLFDGADVRARAEQEQTRRGLAHPDAPVLAEKARGYRAVKQAALGAAGGGTTVLRDYDHFATQHVRFHTAGALRAVLAHPRTQAVRENERLYPSLDQSRVLIHQPQAQAAGYTGAGTSVAVLDSGVDFTRAAFGSCTAPGTPSTCKVAVARDFAPDDDMRDDNGHGTNVAGIVVGVAPATRILALDVFDGGSASTDDIINALDWVVANQATFNIVAANMSLGSPAHRTSTCMFNWSFAAFADLRAAGVLPVVSAGNDARNDNDEFVNGVSNPACDPFAVSVGAVYDANVGTYSESCTDTTTAADRITCFSQSGPPLSLLAPGAYITAAGLTFSGTSQAAPHVAGAVAVLSQAAPTASPNQVLAALQDSGKRITDPRNGITRSRIQLDAALGQLLRAGLADLSFGDFNGDGKTDVFWATGTYWYVSYGGTSDWQVLEKSSTTLANLGFADFNGDGKTDVLYTNGSEWKVKYSGTSDWTLLHTSPIAVKDLRFGDFNGDDKDDIFRANGEYWYVKYGGKGDWQQLNKSVVTLKDLRLGDFNGDGKTDVFSPSSGVWRVSYGGTTTWQQLNTSVVTVEDLRLGDFNGDGNTDVFRASGEYWYVSYGGTSTWQQLNKSVVTLKDIAFGDFNGDGKTDVFSPNGAVWRVSHGGTTTWQQLNTPGF